MPTAELETLPAEPTTKPGTTLIEFGIDVAKLELAVADDLKLKINGLDDKAGYELVNTRRKGYVKQRTGIDKVRKQLNADDQARIKKRNSVADEIQAIIGKGEDHLNAEVDRIDAERERLKTEAADKIYNERRAQLEHVGLFLDRIVVDSMTDEQIAKRIDDQVELNRLRDEEEKRKAAEIAERARLAAEDAARVKAEAEKLAAERAEFARQQAEQEAERMRLQKIEDNKRAAAQEELDKQRAELAAQQDEIRRQQEEAAAERQRLADAEKERQRAARESEQSKQRAAEQAERDRLAAIELEKQKAAAAEQARLETEQRIERERLAEVARLEAEAAEKKRQDAERPWREQLKRLADSLEVVGVPECPKTAAVKTVLTKAADEIRAIAKAK